MDVGVWMRGLCKCKMFLIWRDVLIVAVQMHADECEELQLLQRSANVFRWVAWLRNMGVIIPQLAAALRTLRQCFFMAEREKMPQWRSSFSSCFVSSPLPLLTTAPTLFCSSSQRRLLLWCIVIHCLVLKNEDNACWNTAQAFVGIFRFLHLSSSCLGYKKTKTKVLQCIVWGYGSSS